MKDVFEVQDEMARKIAEALRVTLSPQELEALAVKPTRTCRPTTLLRGKRYARRQTRQDLEFALQMFENAVALDPTFALAHAACANACAMFTATTAATTCGWNARARLPAKPWRCAGTFPKCRSARLGYCTLPNCMTKRYDGAERRRRNTMRGAIIALPRLFCPGRYQEVVDVRTPRLKPAARTTTLRADHEFAGCHGQGRGAPQYGAQGYRRAGESSEAGS